MDADRPTDRAVNPWVVFAGAILLLVIPFALIYFALEFAPSASDEPVRLFGGMVPVDVSPDARMLIFVSLVAALGGVLGPDDWRRASAASLADRWLPQPEQQPSQTQQASRAPRAPVIRRLIDFLLRAFQGAVVGAVFYLLVRAAVVSPDAGVRAINPVGIQMLAFGVGLCSNAVIQTLKRMLTEIVGTQGEVLHAINRLENRFDAAFLEPKLVRFDGLICARVVDKAGKDLQSRKDEENSVVVDVEPGKEYVAQIEFVPETRKPRESAIAQPLKIPQGDKAPLVTFDCVLDSETLALRLYRRTATFSPEETSQTLEFPFEVPKKGPQLELNAPKESKTESHTLYIEVAQMNRLLQSIGIRLEARPVK
jgi:hypothetical protein